MFAPSMALAFCDRTFDTTSDTEYEPVSTVGPPAGVEGGDRVADGDGIGSVPHAVARSATANQHANRTITCDPRLVSGIDSTRSGDSRPCPRLLLWSSQGR